MKGSSQNIKVGEKTAVNHYDWILGKLSQWISQNKKGEKVIKESEIPKNLYLTEKGENE